HQHHPAGARPVRRQRPAAHRAFGGGVHHALRRLCHYPGGHDLRGGGGAVRGAELVAVPAAQAGGLNDIGYQRPAATFARRAGTRGPGAPSAGRGESPPARGRPPTPATPTNGASGVFSPGALLKPPGKYSSPAPKNPNGVPCHPTNAPIGPSVPASPAVSTC